MLPGLSPLRVHNAALYLTGLLTIVVGYAFNFLTCALYAGFCGFCLGKKNRKFAFFFDRVSVFSAAHVVDAGHRAELRRSRSVHHSIRSALSLPWRHVDRRSSGRRSPSRSSSKSMNFPSVFRFSQGFHSELRRGVCRWWSDDHHRHVFPHCHRLRSRRRRRERNENRRSGEEPRVKVFFIRFETKSNEEEKKKKF